MDVKVFLSSHFKESCSEEKISLLVDRFREYKKTGVPHSSFGRDTTYDFPHTVKQAAMSHIHVKDPSSKNWSLKRITYDRTSNTALIYCEGFLNRNYYLLLGFIENAHETYKLNPHYLLDLAEIAEQFRSKF